MKEENKKYYLISFAVILGMLVDYLFYGKPIGVSFFVFILVLIIFSLILTKKFQQKLFKTQHLLLIPVLLFSAMIFCRSSSFLTFFNILFSLFLISLFFTLFLEKNLLDFNLSKYFISPFSLILNSFKKSARVIDKIINQNQAVRKFGSPEFKSAIRGIIISIPILAVFIWLLSSADIVFQQYLDRLLKINIDMEIVLRILIVLVSSCFFIGVFAKAFSLFKDKSLTEFANDKSENSLTKNNQTKLLDSIESSMVLGSVGLLFLVFIIFQFFYLFGAKEYVWGIEEYITYSEYAKKGFGELIAVSIISFLLIYAIDKFGKRENLSQKKLSKILSSVLVFEIFVIMASAFSRLSLYIDGYGYTFSRLLAFAFLIGLGFIFLILLCKILLEKKEGLFLYSAFWLVILFFVGINILNPDAFIAKENIQKYIQKNQQWKGLDIRYLTRLSDDAVPEIVKMFDINLNEDKKAKIAFELNNRYNPPYNIPCSWVGPNQCKWISLQEQLEKIKKSQKWQSFNLSKDKALTALGDYQKEIEEYAKEYVRRYD
ncbi:MAG: DUF4153 domain-containing protein [Candidatus Nealsonbacteria bacterium]